MDTTPFVIERSYNASAAKVWNAITNKNEMKQWYFDLPEFKAEVGCTFSFLGGKDPENPYTHLCEVTEVIAGKKITYSWRYKGYEGISYVSFELFELGDQTKLVLTHAGLETFPASNPDLARLNFAMGWTSLIGDSLTGYLEKQ